MKIGIGNPLHALTRVAWARRFLWRAGRAAYSAARGDLPNDPALNGEYWLLTEVLRSSVPGDRLLDIGANRGDWTVAALERGAASKCAIDAFEPSPRTRDALLARLGGAAVTVHAYAMSDRAAKSTFYEVAPLAGTNSLHQVAHSTPVPIDVTTLDAFLSASAKPQVKFAKVDTEGYDLRVLQGAAETLKLGLIEIVQFEYTWRWLNTGSSLKEVFELINPTPYRLGKLIGSRLEFYANWHPELDRYFEANYVLVRRGSQIESLGAPMTFDRYGTAIRDPDARQ